MTVADADDRVSIGEIARRLDRGFADLKEDMRDLAKRLDGKVDLRYYESLVERVAKIETERERDAERRTTDRRAVFTSLVAPIVVSVIISVGAVVIAMYVALAKGAS